MEFGRLAVRFLPFHAVDNRFEDACTRHSSGRSARGPVATTSPTGSPSSALPLGAPGVDAVGTGEIDGMVRVCVDPPPRVAVSPVTGHEGVLAVRSDWR